MTLDKTGLVISALLLSACPKVPPASDSSPVSAFTDGESGKAEPKPDVGVPTPADSSGPDLTPDVGHEPCPGAMHCACGTCDAGLLCGPNGACTKACGSDAECASDNVDSSVCITATAADTGGDPLVTGLCGVACTDDASCAAVGMVGAKCSVIEGTSVCGY